MTTKVTIELRKKPNKAGLFPLAVRITTNRHPKYRQFGISIKLEDWDDTEKIVKASHPDAGYMNELIAEKLLESRRHLNTIESKNRNTHAFKAKKKKPSNYFKIAQQFLDELEVDENYNRLSVESAYVSYIKKFNKSKALPFKKIDESFLKKFKVYLKKKYSLKETTILNVFVQIRTLYNRAIQKGIVKKKFYPFGKDKVQIKFPQTQKIGLNKEEILELESLTDLSNGEQHALNVWMYSFNFAGMRISDVIKERWSDFQNDRLYYTMNKNSKPLSLKVPQKVFEILKYYKSDKRFANDFIFPELKKANMDDKKDIHRKIKTGSKKINAYLKILAQKAGIEKKLTMHIARHSFGHIAGESIHPIKLQKLYRHSDLKTTLNYQANFMHAEADEALDSVVNF
ncbi:MAG: site-specific integrase [Cellulophaga sp.]